MYVQTVLPSVRGAAQGGGRTGASTPGVDFAHPFERTFADLLSYYGVRWSYEPTSFVLSRYDDGSPREMFTPDFYLPEQRVYIELTAMRQRLVTRKHRKVRRMRDLYPRVAVKLLYRRDYQRLARACRPYSATASVPGATLRDATEISARLSSLATEIAAAFTTGVRPVALGVGIGGTALMRVIESTVVTRDPSIAFDMDQIAVTRFLSGSTTKRVHLTRRPRVDLVGRTVIVFVDIVSSGLTVAYLTSWLQKRGAARIEVCALLSRESARLFDTPVTYVGFLAPHELVVGYGLSLFREHRGLAHIAALSTGDGLHLTPDDDPGLPPDRGVLAARSATGR